MADTLMIRESTSMIPIIDNTPSPISSSPVNGENINANENGSASNAALVKKFKGEKINCGDLRKYLYAFEIYRQASMLRKGREVHKIYVDVHKGVNFLDDRFSLTEFGKMVLDNGSVRAGRARNVRQIVVARETLYCSGTGGCKRACGGYGSCISGCDKIKVRGHKCSFRVKLTMRLGFVDSWFVEILGSHNCYLADNTPSDLTSMVADYDVKSSDGDDSNSLRSSPLSDTISALPTSNQNDSAYLSSSPCLTHQVPANFPPITYPLSIPVFPESYILHMAKNAAKMNNESKSGQHNGKSISPLEMTGLKREVGPTANMIVPEIMNAFLPPGFMPRFMPPPPCISPQLHNNGHHLPVSHTEPSNAMDLTKPRVKEEREDDVPHDLSLPVSTISPSVFSQPVNVMNRVDVVPLKNGENFQVSHKKDLREASSGIYNIPSSLPKSPPSALNCTSTSVPLSRINISSTSSSSSAAPQPFSFSALPGFSTGALSEKARKAICRRLDSHFLQNAESEFKANLYVPNHQVKEETPVSTNPMPSEMAGFNGDCASNDSEIGPELDKDLINRVHQLESHVTQLRNVILKKEGAGKSDTGRKTKPQRPFDFNRYHTRHVALKITYLGWDYNGFVVQEDTESTVEAALFEALLKTKLIDSRETSNYHRCGRTDRGVSAFSQVISLDLRTNLLQGVGVKVREGGTAESRQVSDTTTEIRYVHVLNKVLPPEIRVLAWAPVAPEFSARFSCKKRVYKYFFPKGDLDIELMNTAANKLVGEHDFRNLCKMDVGNGVVAFIRKIFKADVTVSEERTNGYSMCELTVVGQAFLWHQIRCIVTVLFLIGQGKEDVDVLDELLDVAKNPKKPQYTMASEIPLCLFDCNYGDDLEWVYEADLHEDNIRHLQLTWANHIVKATMIRRMLDELEVAKVETDSDIAPWNELSAPSLQQSAWLIPDRHRSYTSLFKRQMCESLEEKIEHFAKRRKLLVDKTEDTQGGS